MLNPNVSDSVSEKAMKSEVINSENSEKSNSEETKCDEGKLCKMSFDIKRVRMQFALNKKQTILILSFHHVVRALRVCRQQHIIISPSFSLQ